MHQSIQTRWQKNYRLSSRFLLQKTCWLQKKKNKPKQLGTTNTLSAGSLFISVP